MTDEDASAISLSVASLEPGLGDEPSRRIVARYEELLDHPNDLAPVQRLTVD